MKQKTHRAVMASLGAILFIGIIISCRTKDKVIIVAGKGGNVTLKITPKHHGSNIDSAKIFIKYDEQNLPAFYDDSVGVQIKNGTPVATFTQLNPGKYYLYCLGWDTTIRNKVKGGLPFVIEDQTNYDISLPVTEGF